MFVMPMDPNWHFYRYAFILDVCANDLVGVVKDSLLGGQKIGLDRPTFWIDGGYLVQSQSV